MKINIIIITLLLIGTPVFAYSRYGTAGYSSYGTGAYSYNSAAATSARYKATHSRYNYGSSSSASYTSTNSANYNYNYNPYKMNKSYYDSTRTTYKNYPETAQIQSTQGASTIKAIPFRYNTLDYTRVRNMESDPPKQYSARCSDIGDASFCR